MIALTLVLAVSAALIAAILFTPHWRRRRHERLRALPFGPQWDRTLRRRVAVYARLPEDLRTRLQGLIRIFLAEKEFVGCAGLSITEEMRLTIAAQACLLIVNRGGECYPWLRTVLVYPGAFIARHEVHDDAGVHTLEEKELSGESWHEGKVILAWEDVRHGARDAADGDNVVYHEFAHQLDQIAGGTDGAPGLDSSGDYRRWASVFSREFEDLHERLDRGEQTLLPEDAAADAGEFFAVVTEVFFERPHELRAERPALYEELKHYYRLDPAGWS